MANFIWAHDRYINLDHVAEIRECSPRNGRSRCISPSGEVMATIETPDFAGEVSTLLPHSGTSHLIWFYEDGHRAYDILAWQIGSFGRHPVLCEELPAAAIYCIVDHGAFVFPEDTAFDTFEEARDHAQTRMKFRADHAAKLKAAAVKVGASAV